MQWGELQAYVGKHTMPFLVESTQLILGILCIVSHPEHYRGFEQHGK